MPNHTMLETSRVTSERAALPRVASPAAVSRLRRAGLLAAVCGALLLAAGCDATADTNADGGAVDAASAVAPDVAADADLDGGAAPDIADAGASALDVAAACPGGTGCPCKANDDCDGSLCLEGPNGALCAGSCTDTCSAGFQCKLVPTGADVAAVCISAWARICNPCREHKDCRYLGIDNARCVDRGEAGGFCGTECTPEGDDCPSDYGCKSVKDIDGNTTKQCVPVGANDKLIACVCSANAMASAAKTTCRKSLIVDDVEVSCDGEAQCKVVGEAATCVAKEPAQETCDGLDNDCDGATDESSCDDKKPCTIDKCDAEKGCVHTPLTEGSSCEADNSVCTQGDKCVAGECAAGTLISCDDKNPCTHSKCDPKAGCVQSNFDGGPCEDGNPCTLGDVCKNAGCVGGATKPCTAIQACKTGVCDASNGGACAFGIAVDGTSCDDGSACSTGDACKGGTCVGVAMQCDDKNACTVDSCDGSAGCKHAANSAQCDDGDACTVGDACKAGVCGAGEKKACDDANPCTTDSCKAGVCVHTPVSDKTACQLASGNAWCIAGTCATKSSGTSCAAVLAANPAATSGTFTIDPDGAGPVASVEVHCDMQLGGWTLVGNYYDTAANDMPDSTGFIVDGWRRTAPGMWSKGAQKVQPLGTAAGNSAVGLAFVAALATAGGQQHLKLCLVHKDGSNSVCRSTLAGSLSLIAYTTGNPKLTAYKTDQLTYTFGRLAGLAGAADGYASFQAGAFAIKRTPGAAGEFGFGAEGFVEKSEDPDCLGDGGPWHGAGCGISYRPHRTGFDELSTASCCLVGGGHPTLTSYGFRLYVGPAPTLGSLNTPASSCQAIETAKKSLGDGLYWLDLAGTGAKAVQVSCLTAAGGGWTQLTDEVTKHLKPGVQRKYLLQKGPAWYTSPATAVVWSWAKGQELSGTWQAFNGTASSSFQCLGSAEKPAFGIGCSAGASQTAKVLPSSDASAINATMTVCQDYPNAFGGKPCEPGVTAWVR